MLNLLKKKIIKKIEHSRSLTDPENYWRGHQQPYNFFPISGHFPITQENENQLIRSRKITCNWEKMFFLDYLKTKDFYSWSKKILISLITGKLVYTTIFVITKIYLFLLIYFTSVFLLIMRSQPASIAWTVTSTAPFYHCWNTQNILIDELDVLYIFYINMVSPYEI